MTDNAHVFIDDRKPITLTMVEKVELAKWIKEQSASQLTYSQLADYAHADLGFLVTPSHVENMWRQINGRRKAEAKQEATPVLPVAQAQIPEGMVLISKAELGDLREALAEALAASFMQSQRAEIAEAVRENYRRQDEIQRDAYDGLVSELKNMVKRFEVIK